MKMKPSTMLLLGVGLLLLTGSSSSPEQDIPTPVDPDAADKKGGGKPASNPSKKPRGGGKPASNIDLSKFSSGDLEIKEDQLEGQLIALEAERIRVNGLPSGGPGGKAKTKKLAAIVEEISQKKSLLSAIKAELDAREAV